MESLRQRTAAFATELYKEVMCEVHRTRLDVATVVVALRCLLDWICQPLGPRRVRAERVLQLK
ncbi:hypothetical protein JG688_00013088 [Phytophthora aleatoria]|uniref:Uncharacterized protein n=1 Tax=Phytophthora aleatoria TaxID=2496075 RepID=A0A8J5ME48_9STRA|nr:hypothetical protein JG688_00013088 [Phytophthora aleatoria]